jgi:hypothetical protein
MKKILKIIFSWEIILKFFALNKKRGDLPHGRNSF